LKTFLDSNVLLMAWKGKEEDAIKAIGILEDRARKFFTASTVKLELLAKPYYFKNRDEVDFYNSHFEQVVDEEPLSAELGLRAFELGKKHGLAAMDALNIAAALKMDVEEFITGGMPGKALFRVPGIKVTTLHAASVSKQ
jgi:predicted nucleic acid-binding protein